MGFKTGLILLASVFFVSCGAPTMEVGKTRYYIAEEGAHLWPGTQEQTRFLQENANAVPEEVWDTKIFVYATKGALGKDAQCYYYHFSENIDAIALEKDFSWSCIPHEFAHKWVDVLDVDVEGDDHGPEWQWRRDYLYKLLWDAGFGKR